MNKTMSPSMTDNQVNKLVELLRAYAQKHRANFSSKDVQAALESKGLAETMFAPFKNLVEGQSEMFTHTVKVNRSITPLSVFKSVISDQQFLSETVVTEMPLGTDEEVTLHFFPIKKQLTSAQYASELESRGLKPDPMAQSAFNKLNPDFSDKYPNGTQWQNQAGNFFSVIWNDLGGLGGCSEIFVHRRRFVWPSHWFACGVSK